MKMRLANWFNAFNFIACLFAAAAYGDYHSQTSQDRILNEIFFHDKRNGVFVDIGAYDGKTISNTYFYEKNLDWTGVCVEPLPDAYKKLQKNRSCITVNCAVGAKNEMISFLEIKSKIFPELAMLSSDMRYQNNETIKKIEAVLKKYEGKYSILTIPMRTINEILSENNLFYIDYLSIDIEGGELDVLQTLDFDKFRIRIMTVENNAREANPLIQQFLESKGFRFVMRLEQDELYENMFFKGNV